MSSNTSNLRKISNFFTSFFTKKSLRNRRLNTSLATNCDNSTNSIKEIRSSSNTKISPKVINNNDEESLLCKYPKTNRSFSTNSCKNKKLQPTACLRLSAKNYTNSNNNNTCNLATMSEISSYDDKVDCIKLSKRGLTK